MKNIYEKIDFLRLYISCLSSYLLMCKLQLLTLLLKWTLFVICPFQPCQLIKQTYNVTKIMIWIQSVNQVLILFLIK